MKTETGHDFQTLFSAFDVDGDGFLNLDEVYQAIHSLGKVWPMKDIREALPKDCKEVDFPGKFSKYLKYYILSFQIFWQ